MAGARPPFRPKRQPFQAGTAFGATKTPLFAKCSKRQQQGNCRTATFLEKKTNTTTSLAVLKRTARQGAHWKHEERGPRKVPEAPKGGAASTCHGEALRRRNGSDGNFLGNHTPFII